MNPLSHDDNLRALFPEFADEKLRDAKERLDDYLAFVVRLYERIRTDPEAYARFKSLTAEQYRHSIKDKRSIP